MMMTDPFCPPDALFRRADDITCDDPGCFPDLWFEQSPTGRWFIEAVHAAHCPLPTEQFYA
jgi:hypothetical protein